MTLPTTTTLMHEGEANETTALVKADPVILPAVSPQRAKEAMAAYQDMCHAVLDAGDEQDISGRKFKKKSAWRKLALVYNLTVDLLSEKETKNEDGSIDFDLVYKATAPNGRSTIGDGSCNSHEKGRAKSRHDTRANAHTRAFNRAVSNLVAAGEVSAEEIESESFSVPKPIENSPGVSYASAKPKKSSSTETTTPGTLGGYRVDLGPSSRWNGKTLEELQKLQGKDRDKTVLEENYDYWSKQDVKRPSIKEFVAKAKQYLEKNKAEPNEEPPPEYDFPF